ncbi:MAG TPA: EAL domain-containing protein [Candidatus Aquabacterium excrementipullorum]|nr:EAL domain-containing protein [Candidatus Aquabacterium excrementipullorum]
MSEQYKDAGLPDVLEQLQKFRLVVEHTGNMVVITDAQRRIEYVNPAYTLVTGWTLDEVRGCKPGRLLQGPRTKAETVRALSRALDQGEAVCDVELVNYTKQGDEYWVRLNIQPVRDAQGVLTHFVAIQADVTEQRRAREELMASERRLAEAQYLARMASFECDLVTHRLVWSRDSARVLALAPAALAGHFMEHVACLHPDDRDLLMDAYWAAASEGRSYEVEYRVPGEDGAVRWLRERGHCLPADELLPNRLSGLIQDITLTKAAQDRIEYLALHDTLTGLANREQLKQLLRQHMLGGPPGHGEQQLALLFMDLDRFKTINDSLGHHVGDEVLQALGARLREAVRASDVVCRLGGDEFVIVLVGVEDPQVVSRVAGKLLGRVAQPLMVQGRELHVTGSLGVSLFPQDGTTVEELMRHADAAMYQAKARGRNTVAWFSPEINALSGERFELESRLRLALQRGELQLHYQPQYLSDGSTLVGFEALLRWRTAEGRWVPPDTFIPLAEEAGLIDGIGAWVLAQACAQWRQWQDAQGPYAEPVRLAVNLSAHQLRRPGLVDRIAGLIAQYGLPPRVLELELTETVAMHDPAASIELMRQLRDLGVCLAVDDFGTGYSSLAYLKALPLDRLKLDRSFVKDIETDPDDRAICSATIVLAHSLGLEVVAEGVETAAQQAYLRGQGCDLMQGFLLGRPVPAEEAGLLLSVPTSSSPTHPHAEPECATTCLSHSESILCPTGCLSCRRPT